MSDDPDYEGPPTTRRNLRQRPQRKTGETHDDGMEEKTKRKVKRKGYYYGKATAYDDCGNIRHNGLDVCDCMNANCVGCWNECPNCGSTRCGPHCRVNRKFYYDSIIHDGKDLVITNKQFPK
ncbi:ARL14 effector protein-like [Scaptodrosophila lebanonensis]|uniref:ARL14 effector protein-like n=1 Tax=Drosophila lebanonensis TaxID=7225 RepID=A0A6J2TSA0_DROLE|nr:ARL14 effector protein-like [Scaptodrosophila lebanonensis]